MTHPLSLPLADTAKFTATHGVLVVETGASLPWLLTGTVLMVQQACVMALSEAGEDLPVMAGPGELVARVSDPAVLEQPYTAPMKPEDFKAFEAVVAARNDVMHPRAHGMKLDPPRYPAGIGTGVRLVRHLCLVQPVRPSMMDGHDEAVLRDSLELIETSLDFWQTLM